MFIKRQEIKFGEAQRLDKGAWVQTKLSKMIWLYLTCWRNNRVNWLFIQHVSNKTIKV